MNDNHINSADESDHTDSRLGRVESNQKTMQSDITSLKTDVSALKTDVSALKTDVSDVKSSVRRLEVLHEETSEKIDQIIEIISPGLQKSNEHTDQLSDHEARITTLENIAQH